MQDNYITINESISLIFFLVGPVLLIGLIAQLIFFKYKNVFQMGRKWVIYIAMFASALLVTILSVLLWVMYPALASDVLTENGITTMPFFPAIISAFIIFPISSWATVFICRKK